jgi:hypothetical protein
MCQSADELLCHYTLFVIIGMQGVPKRTQVLILCDQDIGGQMNAIGKLTPTSYLQDISTRKLIDVVPYGLPSQPPKHTKRVIKGVIPGIGENDTVLLWNSAIPGWLDPATLIYAMEKLWRKRKDIKLLFFGLGDISAERVKGPHKHFWARAREAVALSQELGLIGKNIIFMFDRVPYHDVQNFLQEADIGVSTYPNSLETRLCLGSRLLDFVWARIPLVTSRGLKKTSTMPPITALGRSLSKTIATSVIQRWIKRCSKPTNTKPCQQRWHNRFSKLSHDKNKHLQSRKMDKLCS